jgi:plastocyanin
MKVKKEVDVILIIVFLVLFFGLGSYIGLKDQNGEKIIEIKESTWDAKEGAEELPRPPIEEMPVEITENFKIIEMNGVKYIPSELNISIGTKVYWVNKDDSRNYQVYDKSSPRLFHSSQIINEESFNYTFNEPGVYYFNDAIFTFMNGVIRVE